MLFIKPKNNKAGKVDWEISERTRATVQYYAEYTEYAESEVVDIFLQNILNDKEFLEWIKNKRNNKRIVKELDIKDRLGVEEGD